MFHIFFFSTFDSTCCQLKCLRIFIYLFLINCPALNLHNTGPLIKQRTAVILVKKTSWAKRKENPKHIRKCVSCVHIRKYSIVLVSNSLYIRVYLKIFPMAHIKTHYGQM